MKRKTLKLFLILGVIVLSLFAFASCEETVGENPPENTTDIPDEREINENLEAIKDKELLNFIFTSEDVRFPRPNRYINPIILPDFYNYLQHDDISFVELSAEEEYDIIAAYIPSYLRESIFETDWDTYFQNECNEVGFAKIMQFLESNGISWDQVGLKAYFVKNGEIPLKNGDDELIFVATQLLLFNKASVYRRHIRPVPFKINNNEIVETTFENEIFLGKKIISVENDSSNKIDNDEVLFSRIVFVENVDGYEVVKVNLSAINNSNYGEKFKELCKDALLNIEGSEVVDDEKNITYIYDYSKFKEIFNID